MPVLTTEHIKTLVLLLALLPSRPREVLDRTASFADLAFERLTGQPPTYETVGWEDALQSLENGPGRAAEILATDAFSQRWAADSLFARLCYLACRLVTPDTVVETGVAYGVSSAFLLKAMQQNGRGTLHSIDLPPLRREYAHFWGVALPEDLRQGWRLHRGASRRVLPGLLRETGPVGLFVHDSLHTRRNMRREFDAVWPNLSPGGLLLADDVERNRAFVDLRRKGPSLWRVVRDREREPLHGRAAPVVFGVASKSG
jgi:hypothetical protein